MSCMDCSDWVNIWLPSMLVMGLCVFFAWSYSTAVGRLLRLIRSMDEVRCESCRQPIVPWAKGHPIPCVVCDKLRAEVQLTVNKTLKGMR